MPASLQTTSQHYVYDMHHLFLVRGAGPPVRESAGVMQWHQNNGPSGYYIDTRYHHLLWWKRIKTSKNRQRQSRYVHCQSWAARHAANAISGERGALKSRENVSILPRRKWTRQHLWRNASMDPKRKKNAERKQEHRNRARLRQCGTVDG
jgi:hypothetical protein